MSCGIGQHITVLSHHTVTTIVPVMRPKGGWKSVSDVEIAVAEYVDWYNHRRLHGEIGLVSPAEFEANRWSSLDTEHYPEAPVPAGAGSK